VRRAVVVLAVVVAAAFAANAGATNECRGLQVCVPVAGPWVVTTTHEVRFQLACPARFIVGGLDAELSRRGVDVAFRGGVGSPVNPGITTSTSAIFLARILTGRSPATFRPHIGCIPASGGGQRFPTAYTVAPAKPLAPTMFDLPVVPGIHTLTVACRGGQALIGATHAVGFFTDSPPSPALERSVKVSQTIRHGLVHLTIRAGPLEGIRAVVQADLLCVRAV
jgi:hypothetical protein